jgi:hypothetical protein
MTLLQVQSTERVLKQVTVFFVPQGGRTWEEMLAEEAASRRATVGRFLRALRDRIEVRPEFDDVLEQFLADRNTFAHDLWRIPNFSLNTEEGVQVGIDFTISLEERAAHVRNVLIGFCDLVADALEWNDTPARLEIDNPEHFHRILALMSFRLRGGSEE